MKKLIYILTITIITLNSIYSTTQNSLPYTSKFELQSQIEAIPYELRVSYEQKDLIENQILTIDNLSITQDGETGLFTIYLSAGNQNKTITFTTKITPTEFFKKINNFDVTHTNVVPSIINVATDNIQNIYKKERKPGFKNAIEIVNFKIKWKGNPNLKSGLYSSINTVDISID